MANYKLDYTGAQINNAIGEVVNKNFAGVLTVGGLDTETPVSIGGGTNASSQPQALANILSDSIIPIINGGTGASTADEALANLGGVSVETVWENASQSSSFAAQKILLDLNDADFVDIYTKQTTIDNYITCTRIRVGEASSLTASIYYYRYRDASIDITGVTFGDGKIYNGWSSVSETQNTVAIPIAIYKGKL